MFVRSSRLLPVIAFVLASQIAPAFSANDGDGAKGPWEFVRSDKGIIVHRRTVPGSKLHEFRGMGIIEAPVSAVLAVLNDSEHRREWMKEAVANQRIQLVDPYTEIFYSRTGAPWPVSDRDVVLKAHTTIDPVAHQVRIEISSLTHEAWPEQKGIVRMPFLRGHWHLWPEHGGAWTRAEYQIHADPAGLLTTGIINMVSKSIPHDTIGALQQQVKRRRYPEFESKLQALPEYQEMLRVPEKSTDKPAGPAAGAAVAPGDPLAPKHD